MVPDNPILKPEIKYILVLKNVPYDSKIFNLVTFYVKKRITATCTVLFKRNTNINLFLMISLRYYIIKLSVHNINIILRQ